jgi:hypothetical protein
MPSIEEFLRADERIAYALVFGSTARGSAHAHSDLDLAIGLEPGVRLTAFEIGGLVSALEDASGETVDLVLLDEAGPGLAYRVFRDGTAVFVRDRAAFVARKARAILEYLDWKPVEDLFVRGVLGRTGDGR